MGTIARNGVSYKTINQQETRIQNLILDFFSPAFFEQGRW